MAGNTLGKLFTVTTYGESHGVAIGAIVDGCPPGLSLSEKDIQLELNRRRPGVKTNTSPRNEPDQIQIISGIFEGKTTGAPIGLQIQNQDAKPEDYRDNQHHFRPGHADYTYQEKYGIRDHRGGGRASARETAMRVAAGAIAKKYLHCSYNIIIQAYLAQVGELNFPCCDLEYAKQNPYFIADPSKITALEAYLRQVKENHDSIGARINVQAINCPSGLGEPVYDKLDADIAKAMMSINAAKGVEIGDGFECVSQPGSYHRDQMNEQGFQTNHAGGILGGISTGQTITASVAFKPTSSIAQPGQTINQQGQATTVQTQGRHDPCVGIRAVPIVEAMMALVLMDHLLRHRAQNADHIYQTPQLLEKNKPQDTITCDSLKSNHKHEDANND